MGRRANQRATRKPKGQPNTEPQSLSSRESKAKSFIKKHWAIILSLLIACSGGVPGCITVWNAIFHSKPIITFHANSVNYGLIGGKGDVVQFLESWTIANSGEKPLILVSIDGYVRCHNIEFKLQTGSPPETFSEESSDRISKVTIPNVRSKDLQLIRQIPTNDYRRGFLYFLLDKQSMYSIAQCGDEAELKIVCYDIFGNVYDSGYLKFGHKIERNNIDTLFTPHDSIQITRK